MFNNKVYPAGGESRKATEKELEEAELITQKNLRLQKIICILLCTVFPLLTLSATLLRFWHVGILDFLFVKGGCDLNLVKILDSMSRMRRRLESPTSSVLETSLPPSQLDWSNKWVWNIEKQSSNFPSLKCPPIECKPCLAKFVLSRRCPEQKTREDTQNRIAYQEHFQRCLSHHLKRKENWEISMLCKITCNLCKVSRRINYAWIRWQPTM